MQEASEKKAEERKERIKSWLKEPLNLTLVIILVFAIAIRLYYFFITSNQALWWDEAAYGSIAKTLVNPAFSASPILDREFIIRPLFLPFLWSIFLRLNLSEAVTRFFLILIPSILSVFFTYLIIKEATSRRTALISSFIISALWIHLFYSMRLLTEIPALFFSLVSVYFFVKAYKQDFAFKPFLLSILFLSFSVMMRFPFGLVGFAYILFVIFTARFSILKKKSFWLGGILGLIPLFLFFVYNTIHTGFFFPALKDVSSTSQAAAPYAFYTLGFIPHYFKTAFFILFLLGILLCLTELVLGFGKIRKNKRLESHLFMLVLMLVTLAFFIFIIRAAEDRYLFVSLISFIYLASISIDYLYGIVKKYNRIIAVVLLILVLGIGFYQQFVFGDAMIKSKKESYSQMKEAFLWIKDNSSPDDTVMSSFGELYTIYYAERNALSIPQNETEFETYIAVKKPRLLVVHAFNQHPPYVYQYPQQHQLLMTTEKAWFFDAEQKQPAVIIYRFWNL